MGDPNATEIPAAAAAERTSRFLAIISLDVASVIEKDRLTFVAIDIAK